jgi:hypothetical protein
MLSCSPPHCNETLFGRMQFTGGAWLEAPTMALVAGGVSGQVAIFSVDSHGGTSSLAKIQGHTTFVTAVACSPSGLVVCYYADMLQVPEYACAAPINHEHAVHSRCQYTMPSDERSQGRYLYPVAKPHRGARIPAANGAAGDPLCGSRRRSPCVRLPGMPCPYCRTVHRGFLTETMRFFFFSYGHSMSCLAHACAFTPRVAAQRRGVHDAYGAQHGWDCAAQHCSGSAIRVPSSVGECRGHH